MHHYRAWGERSHSSEKAMCLEKKRGVEGGMGGEWGYFGPEMRFSLLISFVGRDHIGWGKVCAAQGVETEEM